LKTAAESVGLKVQIPQLGSIFSIFFADHAIHDFDDVMRTNKDLYVKMFHALMKEGVYLPPSAFEVSFLSIAHTDAVVDRALGIWKQVLKQLA
jgi:glutamate-1-semialdehyde 2,1-aminomutase